MNEPTTVLIPKQSVEYICRKETVSTNPDDFAHSEMFIRYLDHDAISSFGRWQWANGFNTALVAVKCGLDEIPTIEPEQRWIPCSKRLPEPRVDVWVNSDIGQIQGYYEENVGVWYASFGQGRDYLELIVNAWMPLPEAYREEGEE